MEFQFANVLVFLLLGAITAGLMLGLGWLLRPANPESRKLSTYECGEPPSGSAWINFNIRFYLIALVFVIFDIQYLGVLAQAGALAVPATKGKQQEYVDTLRKKYTQEFYEANSGLPYKDISPNQTEAAEAGEEEAPFEEGAPADSEWT